MSLPPPPGGFQASRTFGHTVLELVEGDLTRHGVDAIVNAANSSLLGGGGVDGAIHRAAGPRLAEECREVVASKGRLPPGEAVLTAGYALPSRFVIHTVGPVWFGGEKGEEQILARCYRSVLRLAAREGLRTVAFPSISTGAFGYPVRKAAPVALKTVREEVLRGGGLERVRFVLWNAADYEVYREALEDLGA
jgi:O-acetyl-ADP-ribose deacetylase (regulator of RNase III)